MSVSKRSELVTVQTPRGAVEIARQQWRSQRAKATWEWVWVARRRGQADWRRGANALEAIRQATLMRPGKQPAWLLEAAQKAEQELAD